jgi:Ca2+-binding RTX toxin-like protein
MAYGGEGDDLLVGDANPNTLRGGRGNDILIGRDHDDLLNGGRDRDILIGGNGADFMEGEEGDDVLIAGTTLYSDATAVGVPALRALRAEWSRTDRDYPLRADMLRWGRGLASGFPLRPILTVFDDAHADAVGGNQDRDWFFAPLTEVLDLDPSGAEFRDGL